MSPDPRTSSGRTLWLYAAWIGAICGSMSGLLGVGGAVILVPLLVAVLKLPQHQAQGTSLAVTIFTAGAALVGYSGSGNLDWIMSGLLILGSVLGAPVGARAGQGLPAHQMRRWFGVLMIVVGIRLFLTQLPEGHWVPVAGTTGIVSLGLLGFGVGFLSGFFGVGGGVVLVPALVLLTGTSQHVAQGVSLAFIVPTAIVGSLTHARLGNIAKTVVLPVAIASMLFAFLAAQLAAALPGTTLRFAFAVLLVAVGARLLLFSPTPAPAKH